MKRKHETKTLEKLIRVLYGQHNGYVYLLPNKLNTPKIVVVADDFMFYCPIVDSQDFIPHILDNEKDPLLKIDEDRIVREYNREFDRDVQFTSSEVYNYWKTISFEKEDYIVDFKDTKLKQRQFRILDCVTGSLWIRNKGHVVIKQVNSNRFVIGDCDLIFHEPKFISVRPGKYQHEYMGFPITFVDNDVEPTAQNPLNDKIDSLISLLKKAKKEPNLLMECKHILDEYLLGSSVSDNRYKFNPEKIPASWSAVDVQIFLEITRNWVQFRVDGEYRVLKYGAMELPNYSAHLFNKSISKFVLEGVLLPKDAKSRSYSLTEKATKIYIELTTEGNIFHGSGKKA